MRAYKGFNRDLTCTLGKGRYQYREGVWIDETWAECGRAGLHCAENPLDCLKYYPNWDTSAYYEVEIGGDVDEWADGSELAATRIRLVRRLDLMGFVAASVEWIAEHPGRYASERTYGKVRVYRMRGEAEENGAVIVYGAEPAAAGKAGSILAMVKTDGRETAGASIGRVDGTILKPEVWYQI
ncbi:MAG TPA: hypothetical protein H9716_09155 [Candidatus Enterocloster faecavium]|uniref:DUF7666 domain-containing protein n=1 Tax=Candidatus Enterocloster faecavium TaxID=2838560 RepID=A0A9D2RL69_9FIRM|nr:hypothetical protein [Candidatus Enterocloster faecavium]